MLEEIASAVYPVGMNVAGGAAADFAFDVWFTLQHRRQSIKDRRSLRMSFDERTELLFALGEAHRCVHPAGDEGGACGCVLRVQIRECDNLVRSCVVASPVVPWGYAL